MRHVFVVGVGRSGTSLVQSMLAAHPDVAYMPETAFIRRYVATGFLEKLRKTSGKDAVIRTLAGDEAFSRSGLEASEVVDKCGQKNGCLDTQIYWEMVDKKVDHHKSWIGDKDPRLIEFLPLLSHLFPDAKIINVIRDPRDVLLSKKRAEWSSKGHVWKHVFANRVQLRLGRKTGPNQFAEAYQELIYENLIANPQAALSGVCEKLGLSFDEAMLDFGDAAKDLVSEKEVSWKKETFGPLLSENKEKWKSGLKPREIVLSEICCREAFSVGGYRRDNRALNLSLSDKVWVLTGAVAIFVMDWPYRFFRNLQVKLSCKRAR